jgi:hypothetical protein
MARCEEGYLCEVCGGDVERLSDSALYLQLVIGWIDPETLHTRRECHLRCLPALAQFIDAPEFDPPVRVTGDFDRRQLDPEFVAARAALVSRGFARLRELDALHDRPPLTDYLLPEARQRWQA